MPREENYVVLMGSKIWPKEVQKGLWQYCQYGPWFVLWAGGTLIVILIVCSLFILVAEG